MEINSLNLDPSCWKILFLLSEQNVHFTLKYVPLSEDEECKFGKYKNDFEFILDNFDEIVPQNLRTGYANWIRKIDCDLVPNVIMPIRFEKVINPIINRKPPSLEKLKIKRDLLMNKLISYNKELKDQDWLLGKDFSLADITLASSLAVLDYLGEIQWKNEKIKSIYIWYLKIKSRPGFKTIMMQKFEAIKPYRSFNMQDF
jgi:glutathione S-transferase